ncbi:trypsin-3-like isoform X2 [Zophobas morio]|uniref:trypsin-3-like isoform X2 n=1 Tax=Zophobas morio TaxID=2755281 RepID=UPI003083E448
MQKINNLCPNLVKRQRQLTLKNRDFSTYQTRIVGGEDINILDVPYQVSILDSGSHFCGGSVVTARHIVTAAHCMETRNVSTLSIRAGSTFWDEGGVNIKVQKAFTHPEYDERSVDYDVAVLRLESFLPFNEFIQPVDLALEIDKWPVNTSAITSGWGLLDEQHEEDMSPKSLKAVVLHVIDMALCERVYGSLMIQVSANMLCVGTLDGSKDACKGDSGGPLVIDGVLAGVISFGFGCARPGLPGIYTLVPTVADFIEDIIFDID